VLDKLLVKPMPRSSNQVSSSGPYSRSVMPPTKITRQKRLRRVDVMVAATPERERRVVSAEDEIEVRLQEAGRHPAEPGDYLSSGRLVVSSSSED
jgi:hypothetical protein